LQTSLQKFNLAGRGIKNDKKGEEVNKLRHFNSILHKDSISVCRQELRITANKLKKTTKNKLQSNVKQYGLATSGHSGD
jgi:hypothetical protein